MRQNKELFEFETGSIGRKRCAALRKICLTVRTFAARVFSHFSFPRLALKCLQKLPLTAFGLHRCPASVSNACDILLNNHCEPEFAVLNRLHRHEAVVTCSRRTILDPHPGCKKCAPLTISLELTALGNGKLPQRLHIPLARHCRVD
jgi:hypothetical protein